MLILASTFILFIIALGLYFRRDRKKHIPLMLGAFALDVILVLVIEIQRKAVETVAANIVGETSPFIIFHALVSLLVLVLYTAQTITGTKIARGKTHLISLHKKMAMAFIILRLINYVTSFKIADFV